MADPGDEAEAFHAGERRLQALIGARERMAAVGRRAIRDYMPEQHRELFGKLPYMLVGSLDADGRPWASLLFGGAGFAATPDARTLRLAALPLAGDPLSRNLAPGAPLGLLGIELHTRRRNRANGRVARLDERGFEVAIEQSFGNCPKYIQARQPPPEAAPSAGAAASARREGARLSPPALDLVRRADAFFIASASARPSVAEHGREGVDVSHRGGPPGFVEVEEADGGHVLTVPDFAGNRFFNTLGNILENPRAGLLFPDFAKGDLLLLTGAAEVVLDAPALARFPGAERLLRFRPVKGVLLSGAMPAGWRFEGYAPQFEGFAA
jgi:predicted pyridoxine 5'-phosphate oxidase superfamily flavin-nucleotide-binding protein